MMSINNNANVAKIISASELRTANHSPFECAKIANCVVEPETFPTRVRVGFCALAGAVMGAVLMGPCGVGAFILAKINPTIAVGGTIAAMRGAIAGTIAGGTVEVCLPVVKESIDCVADCMTQTTQDAKPVTTQPIGVNT